MNQIVEVPQMLDPLVQVCHSYTVLNGTSKKKAQVFLGNLLVGASWGKNSLLRGYWYFGRTDAGEENPAWAPACFLILDLYPGFLRGILSGCAKFLPGWWW